MRKIVFAIAVCLLTTVAFAQNTKHDKTLQLLKLSGSGELGVQMIQRLIPSVKKAYPDVSDKFWNDFMKEINADELITLVVPVYEKYYTEEDIDQLIAFYNSPIGKKMLSVKGNIMQECSEIGKAWGQALAQKIMEKLKRSGYLKENVDAGLKNNE